MLSSNYLHYAADTNCCIYSAALLGFWPDFRSIVRSLGQNARIYDAVYTASLRFASNIEYIYRISIKTASGVHKSCLMLH